MSTTTDTHWLLSINSSSNLTCNASDDVLLEHFTNLPQCQQSPEDKYFEFAVNFYVTFIFCTIGLVLNTVNFKIFCKEHFDGPAYAYMAGISIVDALFLFFHLVSGLTYLKCEATLAQYCPDSELFLALRKASAYVTIYIGMTATNSLQTISAWLTVLLGIERYMAMKYFHFRRTRCHKTDAKLTIFLLCIVGTVFNFPYSFNVYIQPEAGPQGNDSYLNFLYTPFGKSEAYSVYSFIRLCSCTLLPCAILVVNNLCLLVLVMSHNRRHDTSGIMCATTGQSLVLKKTSNVLQASIRRIQAQKQLTMLLIIVIFVFLLGHIPRSLMFKDIFTVIYQGCPCSHVTMYLWVCCPIFRKLRSLFEANYLLCLNANFFVYFFLNKHFRAHVLHGCCSTTAPDSSPCAAVELRSPPQREIITQRFINGSPPPSRRHSCVTFDSNCLINNAKQQQPSSGHQSNASSFSRICGQHGSAATSTRSLHKSDDIPREEMDDLLFTTVMITRL